MPGSWMSSVYRPAPVMNFRSSTRRTRLPICAVAMAASYVSVPGVAVAARCTARTML